MRMLCLHEQPCVLTSDEQRERGTRSVSSLLNERWSLLNEQGSLRNVRKEQNDVQTGINQLEFRRAGKRRREILERKRYF